jgi:RimJ/RimL family protein N-acetyltransferase
MSQISIRDVHVREFQREDLADMRRYFFESSPEFLNRIGLKTPQPGEAETFQARWEQRLNEHENGGSPIEVMTVLYRGERVGFHTSTHRQPGQSLVMHAHFFREDLRGKGIGTVS